MDRRYPDVPAQWDRGRSDEDDLLYRPERRRGEPGDGANQGGIPQHPLSIPRRVDAAIAVVKRSCRTRTQYINPMPPMMEPGEFYMANPVDIQLGGATIFVLDVDRFEQI